MRTPISRRSVLAGASAAAAVAATTTRQAGAATPPAAAPAAAPGLAGRAPAPGPGFYDRPGLESMPRVDWASMPVVDVLDAGARGDGVADDRPAFDRAVDRLDALGGGVLRVPAGRFRFARRGDGQPAWSRTLRDVHVVGAGEATVIAFERGALVDGPGGRGETGWALDRAERSTLRSFSMTWTPAFLARNSLTAYTLNMSWATDCQLVDLHVDQGQPAVWLPFSDRTWVVDCVVRNAAADAIHLESGRASTAAYNWAENVNDDAFANFTNTSVTADTGVLRGVRHLHNTAIGVAWGRGLTLGGADHLAEGNWLEAVVEAGVYGDVGLFDGAPPAPLLSAAAVRNTLVRCNTAHRADNALLGYGTGGYQGAFCFRDAVDGLVLEDNTVVGAQLHGVTLGIEDWRGLDGRDISLRGNRFEDLRGTGVRVIGTALARDVDLRDNTLLATGGPSVGVEGVLEGVTSAGNVVSALPVVSGRAEGDLGGFTAVPDDAGLRTYVDVYAAVRAEDDLGPGAAARPVVVAEPVPDRRGPRPQRVVSVADHGARGDGVHDDRAALQSALDSLPADGGVLVLPRGRYRVGAPDRTSTVAWSRVPHHLVLEGRRDVRLLARPGAVLEVEGVDAHGLRLVGCERVALSGLAVRCTRAVPLRRNRALVDVSGCRDVRLSRLDLRGSSGPGLQVDSCSRVVVDGVEVADAGTDGISVGASRQVELTRCTVAGSRDDGVHVGWMGSIAREPQGVLVERCTVEGTREGAGLSVTGGSDVVLRGNRVSGTFLAGVHVWARASNFPLRSVRVRANTLVRTNTGARTYTPGAIAVHGLVRGRHAADVEITDNVVLGTPHAGVWVGGPTPVGEAYAELDRLVVRPGRSRDVGGALVDVSPRQAALVRDLQLG